MNFAFTYSPLWLIPVALLAAAAAWWKYRDTRGLLPQPVRLGLTAIRFLLLTLLAALLLEPLLNAIRREETPPGIAVLQDVSESIGIQRDSAFARQTYPGLLNNFIRQAKKNGQELNYYEFGARMRPGSPDSLRYQDAGTDISSALSQTQKLYQNQNLGAVVLISDGIVTSGASPVYSLDRLKQPVYAVLLGDTTLQRDVRINEVLYNEIAYLNTQIPIRAKIQAEGYEQAQLKVTLSGEGKTLGVKELKLSRNQQSEVEFLVTPTAAGVQNYELNVSRLDGEITYRNNSRRLFITVLETRVNIALFAGVPHPDIGALTDAFNRQDQYTLSKFIRKNATQFYEDPAQLNFASVELFLLHNFPLTNADKAIVQQIANEIEKRNVPLICIIGASTDLGALGPLLPYMALVPNNAQNRSEEVNANFLDSYKRNSTYTFGEDWISWANAAPPIIRNRATWVAKTDAEVLATAKIKNIALDYPVYALQSQLGKKNMVFVGENLWRMRAHSYIEKENFDYFDDWIFNNIKWLCVADDRRKFKVTPSKRMYSGGEPVIFKGQAYDDSYNPLPDVEIKLSIRSGDNKETDYFLNEKTPSQYDLDIYNLPEGLYTYRAEGRKNDKLIGNDKGQFIIGRSGIEHQRLRADADLMRQIALRTNGRFILAKDIEQLPALIQASPDMKPVISFKKNRLDFHRFSWILAVLIGLAAAEWIIRKIYSMV